MVADSDPIRCVIMGSHRQSIIVINKSAQVLAAHDRATWRGSGDRRLDQPTAQGLMRSFGQVVVHEDGASVAQSRFVRPDGFAQDAILESFDESFRMDHDGIFTQDFRQRLIKAGNTVHRTTPHCPWHHGTRQ